MKTCVLIVGHGSRREKSNKEFETIFREFSKRHPEYDFIYGYVELASPSLEEALREAAAKHEKVVVLPLFLFMAGHVKNDIPLLLDRVRRDFPEVEFVSARALGADGRLAKAIEDRLIEKDPALTENPQDYAIVVIGRGSSDPDANADFFKLVRLFQEGKAYGMVQPTFVAITHPLVPRTLDLVARARPKKLLVIPYLLFGGVLVERMQKLCDDFAKKYAWINCQMAPYIGFHEAVYEVLGERLQQAITGEEDLACDNCAYRIELPGHAEKAGGLKALLWSLRHTFTHTQAKPADHAHPPMQKHVLVCGNVDCADKGSLPLIENLRREIKARDCQKKYAVTKTSCMGRCGEGPNVIVYPDGIFYRDVTPNDAEELVEEHFVNDRLVSRLVDNIMQ
jgi:sirohydrochlorin cobaltochelatase